MAAVGCLFFGLCPLGLFLKDEAEKDFYPLGIIAIAIIIYVEIIVRILIKAKHIKNN